VDAAYGDGVGSCDDGGRASGLSAKEEQYVKISSRACHDGNKICCLKALQVAAGNCRRFMLEVPGRVEVDVGRKGVREGVRRAFRWRETESSTVERERRRKSRRAVVLKQNWGMR
jgi:hypothetical protein